MNRSAETNEPKYPIRDIAKKFDISTQTLHMYERAGLLLPFKKKSKHRLYSDEDILKVDFIVSAIREEGLNLEGVRRLMALLPCWKLISCSQQNRNNCPAYHNYKKPCWTIEETVCWKTNGACRECVVYRKSTEMIKQLKDFMKQPSGVKQAH